MDENSNSVLSQLRAQLRQDSLVKGIADLQVGDIVYYDMDREDGINLCGPYDTRLKYVVVAGSKRNQREVCALLINSHNDYSSAEDWKAEQYLISQCDYQGILDHDSWIDCTDPKELKVSKIVAKTAEKKGHLNNRDLRNVINHLKTNDFVSNIIRREYGIDVFDPEP